MKKVVVLLFTTILFIAMVGCYPDTRPEGYDQIKNFTPQDFTYRIAVSFCNDSGDDIIAPLGEERWTSKANTYWKGEINPDKYDLAIDLSIPWGAYSYQLATVSKPTFRMEKYSDNYQSSSFFGEEYREGEGKYYLTNVISMPTYYIIPDVDDIEEMQCQDYIKYKISCPTIFGDDSGHTLVAYWVEDPSTPSDWDYPIPPSQNPLCIRATFDGKEVVVNKVAVGSGRYRESYSFFINIVIDE